MDMLRVLVLDYVHSSWVERSRSALDLTIAQLLNRFYLVESLRLVPHLASLTRLARLLQPGVILTRWRHQACHGAWPDSNSTFATITNLALEAVLVMGLTIWYINFNGAVVRATI